MGVYAVEMRGITKAFQGAWALDDVTLQIRQGEIHALLGDNGAGKTTLLRALSGLCRPDGGTVLCGGSPVRIASPRRAMRLGIGLVPRGGGLAAGFSALDNLLLGRERALLGVMRKQRARREATEICQRYGLDLDWDARAEDMTAGDRLRAAVVKLLWRGCGVLLLDEPTADLTAREAEGLLKLLRALAGEGKAILLSTRRLSEALSAADRITVLRGGKSVGTADAASADGQRLSWLMLGGAAFAAERREISPGRVVLEARDVTAAGPDGKRIAVKGVSFEVRSGEIVCIAGAPGSGQERLIEALTGLVPLRRGRIRLNGRNITPLTARERARAGIAYIPGAEGRGVALGFTLAENMALRRYWTGAYQDSGFLLRGKMRVAAEYVTEQLGLLARRGCKTLGRELSPRDRRMLAAAREGDREADLLIAEQPTKGLDAESAEAVRQLILAQRDSRRAVLLVSGEWDEIMNLSDRILVLRGGEIVGEFDPRLSSVAALGLYMTGTQRQSRFGGPWEEAEEE